MLKIMLKKCAQSIITIQLYTNLHELVTIYNNYSRQFGKTVLLGCIYKWQQIHCAFFQTMIVTVCKLEYIKTLCLMFSVIYYACIINQLVPAIRYFKGLKELLATYTCIYDSDSSLKQLYMYNFNNDYLGKNLMYVRSYKAIKSKISFPDQLNHKQSYRYIHKINIPQCQIGYTGALYMRIKVKHACACGYNNSYIN